MTYDTLGRTLSMTDHAAPSTVFTYNDIARTATDAFGNTNSLPYVGEFDEVSGYVTTAANRMTSDGTLTNGYKDLGEVTSKWGDALVAGRLFA